MTLLQEERPVELDNGRRELRLPELDSDRPEGEPLLVDVADLVPEAGHRFGRREVRVYRDGVSVHDDGGDVLEFVAIAEIKSARTEPLVGGARLELRTGGGTGRLAEFTASVAARFSEMARGIEQLARGEELNIKWTQERTRCPRCDRLLPEKDGRCPACIRRMAVLMRIL